MSVYCDACYERFSNEELIYGDRCPVCGARLNMPGASTSKSVDRFNETFFRYSDADDKTQISSFHGKWLAPNGYLIGEVLFSVGVTDKKQLIVVYSEYTSKHIDYNIHQSFAEMKAFVKNQGRPNEFRYPERLINMVSAHLIQDRLL